MTTFVSVHVAGGEDNPRTYFQATVEGAFKQCGAVAAQWKRGVIQAGVSSSDVIAKICGAARETGFRIRLITDEMWPEERKPQDNLVTITVRQLAEYRAA